MVDFFSFRALSVPVARSSTFTGSPISYFTVHSALSRAFRIWVMAVCRLSLLSGKAREAEPTLTNKSFSSSMILP